MNFRVLGSYIEYVQAAKRLEEIADAKPNSAEAQEYKELLRAFIRYEKELHQLSSNAKPKQDRGK